MVYGGGQSGDLTAFWKGARERRLMIQQCRQCSDRRFPPTAVCPNCLSPDQIWTEASGRARVESLVTFHQRYWPDCPTPYSVVLVKLEEGPLMMSNCVGAAPAPDIGDQVSVVFVEKDDGSVLPQFVVASEG